MSALNLGCFEISTYLLVIGIAFLISFGVFYKISKKNYIKLDIIYVYVINIVGFVVGSKLVSLISNNIEITIYNFIDSGYSFLGGMLGSMLSVALYCKKYKLDFTDILSKFTVIYPLIYSISKIGCFLNGCCYGIINNYKFPLPLIDIITMFILFLVLLSKINKQKNLIIGMCFCNFGVIRFFEDFFRKIRSTIIFCLTLEQIICGVLLIIGIINILNHKQK